MKKLFTLLIIILATAASGQNSNPVDTNCLAIVNLKFEKLDSNAVKSIGFTLLNSKYLNILSYIKKGHIRLAYYTKDKNNWTSIELPFSEVTNDFGFIYSSDSSASGIIVKGNIGKSENRGRSEFRTHTYVMVIINIRSTPTQILKINYGCDEAQIAFDGARDQASFFHKYERKIEVTEKGVIISTPERKLFSFKGSILSDIPDGTYIFDGPGLKKENK